MLDENMVVSIKPGLAIENAGGWRHRDTVLVTACGHRCRTHSPTRLDELVLPKATWRHRVTNWGVKRSLRLEAGAAG